MTPIKQMKVSGRRTLNDKYNGIQQFEVSGNVGKTDLRAELQLNQQQPGVDMKLFQGGNNGTFICTYFIFRLLNVIILIFNGLFKILHNL